jgi:hypothetical protein
MSLIVKNFDMRGIVRKLHRISTAVHEPLQILVKEQARLFISSTGNVPGMAQIIPPSHQGVKGAAAGRHGRAVVAADISSVYATPGEVFAKLQAKKPAMAKAFWVAVKGRSQKTKKGRYRKNTRGATNLEEATRLLHTLGGYWANIVLLESFDDGALHRAARHEGKVTRTIPVALLADTSQLLPYIKKRQDNVGLLASMLNRPVAELGAKGNPTFVEAHGNKMGAPLRFKATDHSYSITIDLSTSYGGEHFQHRVPYIIQYRENALKRAWPYVQRYLQSKNLT